MRFGIMVPREKTVMRELNTTKMILALAGITLIFGLVVVAPRVVAQPTLDQGVLTDLALMAAQEAGLQGEPKASATSIMSLAEWGKLNDAELGKDAAQFGLSNDMTVFVLAMRGDVVWQMPSLPRPGESESHEHYGYIVVALNAATGEVISIGAKRDGAPVPIFVP
jgi:hypothetical protein